MTGARWFRDPLAWRLIVYGYLPRLAMLNLAWETAHVRLYTLWTEAEPLYITFSVVHCTLGDVLIGGLALLLALILCREGELAEWRWLPITFLAVILGAGYTIISEWMNITILGNWVYSEAMPRLEIGPRQTIVRFHSDRGAALTRVAARSRRGSGFARGRRGW